MTEDGNRNWTKEDTVPFFCSGGVFFLWYLNSWSGPSLHPLLSPCHCGLSWCHWTTTLTENQLVLNFLLQSRNYKWLVLLCAAFVQMSNLSNSPCKWVDPSPESVDRQKIDAMDKSKKIWLCFLFNLSHFIFFPIRNITKGLNVLSVCSN